MAKKPLPMPVSNEPDYPPLSEMNERALEHMAQHQRREEPMYAACPGCGQQLTGCQDPLRSTGYETTRPVFCSSCGWEGRAVSGCY